MSSKKKNWFKKAVLSSELPTFLSNYTIRAILAKSRSFDGTYSTVDYDVLFCSFSICETGNNSEISSEQFQSIMKECSDILNSRPNNTFPFNRFGIVQGIRPYWYSIPLYAEILEPFNEEFESLFEVTIEEVFHFVEYLSLQYETVNENYAEIAIPANLRFLISDLTIKLSDIEYLEDVWDKMFVQVEDDFVIPLFRKFPESAYTYLCKKLKDNVRDFGHIKGHSIELLIEQKLKQFTPHSDLYHSYYIKNNDGEKDLLIESKEMGFCVECKSLQIKKSTYGGSERSLNRAAKKNISKAFEQIKQPLVLLSKGGIILHDDIEYKVKPKKYYYGFIITDQIYSPLIRASIEHLNYLKLENKEETWHGENIWIGSIIDFIFLLEVTTTPSILFDYFSYVRSVESLKHTDEPESWLLYCMDPIIPNMLKAPKVHNINLMCNDFGWDKFKEKRAEYCIPIWLENELNLIRKYDRSGLSSKSLSIINRRRKKVSKHFQNKFMKESLAENGFDQQNSV
ncbi:hypothetical protein [Methanohalophilus halophilus]|uniref:Uncharacterized protein n=1 Tax=Methanohalophilus halophilus TaxID=2177 RepID=A0A1L3Q4G8_9EURY|nr:hypothetical protein [Methanohalophilus halophilus]APH39774.1 hypothetical protein BHR79_10000 [Methanohalophilus halophilus]RNI08885.1 hypothetical protein EFE40_05260 [Methanohalophilus halophilus]SDW40022.1 hypothetical protein SAMN04515625_0920 [Methanohalophilus halophilus]